MTTFAAILSLFSISFGQSDSKKHIKGVSASKIKVVRTNNQESILSVTITDPNGAVIPEVEIILFQIDRKKKFKFKSDKNGEYRFSSLESGIYEIKVHGPNGFKAVEITNLEINAREKSQIDIILEPTDTNVIVGIVGADEQMIDTTSSSVTTKITKKQMESLPF